MLVAATAVLRLIVRGFFMRLNAGLKDLIRQKRSWSFQILGWRKNNDFHTVLQIAKLRREVLAIDTVHLKAWPFCVWVGGFSLDDPDSCTVIQLSMDAKRTSSFCFAGTVYQHMLDTWHIHWTNAPATEVLLRPSCCWT